MPSDTIRVSTAKYEIDIDCGNYVYVLDKESMQNICIDLDDVISSKKLKAIVHMASKFWNCYAKLTLCKHDKCGNLDCKFSAVCPFSTTQDCATMESVKTSPI